MTLIERIDELRQRYESLGPDEFDRGVASRDYYRALHAAYPEIRRVLVAAKAVDDSASCNDYGDLCADPDRLDELTEALAALDGIK